MIEVVPLIFRTENRFKLFWKRTQNRFRDEEEARDLELTKMNIRRRLEEVSTGF